MTAQPKQSGFRQRLRRLRGPNPLAHPFGPRPERRDCQGRLVAQLLATLGEGWALAEASFNPWCSATFIGARHQLHFRFEGDQAIDRAMAEARRLPEFEFRIAGHVVADLAVDVVREVAPGLAELALSVLTVEDW